MNYGQHMGHSSRAQPCLSLSVPKSINDANTLEKLVITTYEHRRRPNIAQCAQKRCPKATRPSADQR